MTEIDNIFEKHPNLYVPNRYETNYAMFITIGRTFINELTELIMSSYSPRLTHEYKYSLWASKPEIDPSLGFLTPENKGWISEMWSGSERKFMEELLYLRILNDHSDEVPEPELIDYHVGDYNHETRFYKLK